MKTRGYWRRRERGAIGLMATSTLFMVIAFGALATDVARIVIIRNELQNAADAAALVGAGGLSPGFPTPNWDNGITQGNAAIPLNATEGVKLATGVVQAGYWDLSRTKSGLQAQTITPGTNDVPAVQVTISRSVTDNNGPVSMLLAAAFGVPAMPMQATAVAVLSAPGTAGPGVLLPLAIGVCQYQKYWDYSQQQPLIDPTTNKPFVFSIYDSYSPGTNGGCDNGQWTTFNSSQTGASTVTNLINTGNLTPLSINNDITFLNNGVADSIYKAVIPLIGTTVFIPVVQDVVPGSSSKIVAFAAFNITDVNRTGTPKYISGSFVGGYKIPSSGGTGPYYGAYVPPRLAW